ncbi:MAG: Uma2 family endonuclease [Planctomycetes bacterium]|nr:Uma2 family endonuclease [Planctomycetota bacterium]
MATSRPVTAEELALMGEGRRELIYGRVVEMSPTGGTHGWVTCRIGQRLLTFLDDRPLGRPFVGDTGFLLARKPDLVRAPDVAFVAADRLTGVDLRKYLPFAPDLAVEVASPDDTATEVDAKARMWVACGSRLVWVVFPDERMVHVYRPDQARAELTPADTLSGEDLLPGFALPVSDFL